MLLAARRLISTRFHVHRCAAFRSCFTVGGSSSWDGQQQDASSQSTRCHLFELQHRSVETTYTREPREINEWIARHVLQPWWADASGRRIAVGLDTEWTQAQMYGPNPQLGVLQLAVGSHVLVAHICQLVAASTLDGDRRVGVGGGCAPRLLVDLLLGGAEDSRATAQLLEEIGSPCPALHRRRGSAAKDLSEGVRAPLLFPPLTVAGAEVAMDFGLALHTLRVPTATLHASGQHQQHTLAELSPLARLAGLWRAPSRAERELHSAKHPPHTQPRVWSRNVFGLEALSRQLLGLPPWKSRSMAMSAWGRWPLSHRQVQYAAMDALASLWVHEALVHMVAVQAQGASSGDSASAGDAAVVVAARMRVEAESAAAAAATIAGVSVPAAPVGGQQATSSRVLPGPWATVSGAIGVSKEELPRGALPGAHSTGLAVGRTDPEPPGDPWLALEYLATEAAPPSPAATWRRLYRWGDVAARGLI